MQQVLEIQQSCHGFRLSKRDDYFQATFGNFSSVIFE